MSERKIIQKRLHQGDLVLDLSEIQDIWELTDERFSEVQVKVQHDMIAVGLMSEEWNGRGTRAALDTLVRGFRRWFKTNIDPGQTLKTRDILSLAQHCHWEIHKSTPEKNRAKLVDLEEEDEDDADASSGTDAASGADFRSGADVGSGADAENDAHVGINAEVRSVTDAGSDADAGDYLRYREPFSNSRSAHVESPIEPPASTAPVSDRNLSLFTDRVSGQPSIENTMVQVRRLTESAMLYRPQDLCQPAQTRPIITVEDVDMEKLMERVTEDMGFDEKCEKIVYARKGADDICISSVHSWRAALEEMVRKKASRFCFVIKSQGLKRGGKKR